MPLRPWLRPRLRRPPERFGGGWIGAAVSPTAPRSRPQANRPAASRSAAGFRSALLRIPRGVWESQRLRTAIQTLLRRTGGRQLSRSRGSGANRRNQCGAAHRGMQRTAVASCPSQPRRSNHCLGSSVRRLCERRLDAKRSRRQLRVPESDRRGRRHSSLGPRSPTQRKKSYPIRRSGTLDPLGSR